MQYLLTAYDGEDEGALARRMKMREQHIALGDQMAGEGRLLFAAAILDDTGKMIGSSLVLDFPSQAQFDAWLAVEPYVVGKVWEDVQVRPCRVGPTFAR